MQKRKKKYQEETEDDYQLHKDVQSTTFDCDYIEIHVCDQCTIKSAEILNLKLKKINHRI